MGASATYTWTLGEETINQRVFSRNQFPFGEKIQVSLTVNASANVSCFPNDDGFDTSNREFYTFKLGHPSLYEGEFRGINLNNPTDSFNITIAREFGSELIYDILQTGCRFRLQNSSSYQVHRSYDKFLSFAATSLPQNDTICGKKSFFFGLYRNDELTLKMLDINNDTIIFKGNIIN